MINAAMVGLGWWGKTLVESVQGTSDVMQFVACATRTASADTQAFAKEQNLKLASGLDEVLADPKIEAVVLATPVNLQPVRVARRKPLP